MSIETPHQHQSLPSMMSWHGILLSWHGILLSWHGILLSWHGIMLSWRGILLSWHGILLSWHGILRCTSLESRPFWHRHIPTIPTIPTISTTYGEIDQCKSTQGGVIVWFTPSYTVKTHTRVPGMNTTWILQGYVFQGSPSGCGWLESRYCCHIATWQGGAS